MAAFPVSVPHRSKGVELTWFQQPDERGRPSEISYMATMATKESSDTELMARIAKDDEAALRLIFQRYSGLVFSLAQRMLRDPTHAEEIVQETFLRVWRTAATFDAERGKAEAWIVTIARNLAVSALRKAPVMTPTNDENILNALVDDAISPEEAAMISDRRHSVREAIAQLPERQRQVVVLSYFDGLTHAEIAERIGEPLGTVKSRLRLALGRLKQILQVSLRDWPLNSPLHTHSHGHKEQESL